MWSHMIWSNLWSHMVGSNEEVLSRLLLLLQVLLWLEICPLSLSTVPPLLLKLRGLLEWRLREALLLLLLWGPLLLLRHAIRRRRRRRVIKWIEFPRRSSSPTLAVGAHATTISTASHNERLVECPAPAHTVAATRAPSDAHWLAERGPRVARAPRRVSSAPTSGLEAP